MRLDCVILAQVPNALTTLCGISVLERLLRTVQRCGVSQVTILSSNPELIAKVIASPCSARPRLKVEIRQGSAGMVTVARITEACPSTAELVLVVRGDAVLDIRLLRLLLRRQSQTTIVDSAVPTSFSSLVASSQDTRAGKLCGATLFEYGWLSKQTGALDALICKAVENNTVALLDVAKQRSYDPRLRRDLRPVWFLSPSFSDQKLAERVLLDSVQKGSLDFPALLHAPIEKFMVARLCHTSITPHQLTIAWIIIACATTVCFALGQLWWGIVLALMVGLIDGLDGKQARIKVETSETGKLEHRFDSLFEIAWPTALAYYFYSSGQLSNAFLYLGVLLLAEALDGIGKAGVYSTSEKLLDQPGAFDRVVRFIGGRRNIYIWVLVVSVILDAAAKALMIMAWWEVLTAAVDLTQAAISLRLLQRKRLPESF